MPRSNSDCAHIQKLPAEPVSRQLALAQLVASDPPAADRSGQCMLCATFARITSFDHKPDMLPLGIEPSQLLLRKSRPTCRSCQHRFRAQTPLVCIAKWTSAMSQSYRLQSAYYRSFTSFQCSWSTCRADQRSQPVVSSTDNQTGEL